MSQQTIICPQCRKPLRLRDPQRQTRGRCPACGHRFEIGAAAPPTHSGPQADSAAPPAAAASQPAAPAKESSPAAPAKNQPPPPTGTAHDQAPPAVHQSAPPRNEPAPQPAPRSDGPAEPMFVPLVGSAPSPAAPLFAESSSELDRLRRQRTRSRRRRNVVIGLSVVLLLALGVGFVLVRGTSAPEHSVAQSARNGAGAPETPAPAETSSNEAPPASARNGDSPNVANGVAKAGAKGAGPIRLNYLPAGARIVIHLRPAELWSDEPRSVELRACLRPLFEWGEASLRNMTGCAPGEIEEITIGLVLRGPGTPPDVSSVVRLVTPLDPAEIASRMKATPVDGNEAFPRSYTSSDRAVLIADEKTFAVAPTAFAREMTQGAESPNPTDAAIEELLPATDRARKFTLICRPDDVLLTRDVLVPALVSPLVRGAAEWLNPEEVESFCWSLDPGEEFESRVDVRNRAEVVPDDLQAAMEKRLAELPRRVLAQVEPMDPVDSGRRRVIGRFPAMLQLLVRGTQVEAATRRITWITRLHERAAPNLALATLLTWDESLRTRRPGAAVAGGAASPAPKSLRERLNKPIAIDFRRTPLQEALAYIADETQVPIDLDGDGLRQKGYTRNMPQTMSLGTVPALQALAAILKQYDEMVLAIDEPQGKAVVTVKAVAKSRGLQPVEFPPQ